MAIDSAEKRRSAANIGYWLIGPGVTPNASPDAEWREQAAYTYSGIAVGAGGGGGGGGSGGVFSGGVFG